MRITKMVWNQYLKVSSLIDENTFCRNPCKRQEKTKALANKFAHILRHSPAMKQVGFIAKSIDRWGLKLSHDQAYRA